MNLKQLSKNGENYNEMTFECRKSLLKGVNLTRDFFREFCNLLGNLEKGDFFKKELKELKEIMKEEFYINLQNNLKSLFEDTEDRLKVKEIELIFFLKRMSECYLINTKKDIRLFVYGVFETYLMNGIDKTQAQKSLQNFKNFLQI